MRVLRIHNAYTATGGEDRSVQAEITMLERAGVEVHTFLRSNQDLVDAGVHHTVGALWRTAWDQRLYREIRSLCRELKPDVAHADNLWFALSPSVHAACKAEGVATVQTLRNYRLLCIGANLLRDGKPCEDCVGKSPWPGVRHRCYRGSTMLSLAVARMIQRNRRRGTWDRDVDVLIAASEFARNKFIEGGLPAAKFAVKPNFVEDPGEPVPLGIGGVYVGRLSPEKGVHTLIDAWRRHPSLPLTIIGDGPERERLEQRARSLRLIGTRFLGQRTFDECAEAMRRAAFLVFPSDCYETFGRTVVEAFALGRPVIATREGSAAELVEPHRTGLLFQPRDSDQLASQIMTLATDRERTGTLGRAARETYLARYTPERNLGLLTAIYERALGPRPTRPVVKELPASFAP